MPAPKTSQVNGGGGPRPPPPPPTICSSSASASLSSGLQEEEEEDFIGTSHISSTAFITLSEPAARLRPPPVKEPDLRLGLGPSPSDDSAAPLNHRSFGAQAMASGPFHSVSADPRPKKPKRPFSDVTAPAPAYWGVSTGPSWSSNANSNRGMPVQHSDGFISMKNRTVGSVECNLQSALDEDPPSKEPVIGWPPVRSYRRTAINVGQSRPAGTNADARGANYVKVNMDGIPVGRKVGLNSYNNYDELLCALERMFNTPPVGAGGNSFQEREFVLTYEDKEGDWMLVGDVPWGMFIKVVKRLRITRASDATCVGSTESKTFASATARIHH